MTRYNSSTAVGLIVCLAVFLFAVFSFRLQAQQDSQYTQYMYNTTIINPAYAGSRGLLSINSIYRNQWVGINGAPETIEASVNSPIGERGVGMGLSFFHDKIGPQKETNINLDFSYTIKTSEQTKLSFGLKGGFNLLDVNLTLNQGELIGNNLDPNAQNVDSQFSPTIGAGLYLHTDKWYVGLSSPNLLKTDHNDAFVNSSVTEEVHFYGIIGYTINLSHNVKFKPAVLAKAVSGAPMAIDGSANFMFRDKFILGAAYRWDAAVSGLAGFQVSDQLMIGYAYDYDTTELTNYNSGSHEIFLRFELFTKVRQGVCPRFF